MAGEGGSGEEALDVVAATAPDVVIMDIEMPGMSGIEATRRLLAGSPRYVVLVLTMYGEDEFVFAALRAGARGYVVKGAQQAPSPASTVRVHHELFTVVASSRH